MMSEAATACLQKYRENLALADAMDQRIPDHNGWACVVRFYAVVHLVNAYLIDKPQLHFDPASTEHVERRKAMDQCPELRDAPRRYRELKDMSEAIRYDAGFKYGPEHDKNAKANLRKIAAVVEPKLVKR